MNIRIEKAIGEILREKGWTLSIAESCTGGLVCDHITDVPGSSEYFMGGMVTYSNSSKMKYLGVSQKQIEQYGVVSPQVAKSMALGVRRAFGTTFGFSSTGIAGPSGGSKKKPVGLVFIGLAKERKTGVRKLNLKGGRRKIKKEAARLGLHFIYDFIKEVR